MVKHTQKIRRQDKTFCLSMFGHFVGLVVKGLMLIATKKLPITTNILIISFSDLTQPTFTCLNLIYKH